MNRKLICTALFLLGIGLGAAGLYHRVSGAAFFTVLWIIGVAALNFYWAEKRS